MPVIRAVGVLLVAASCSSAPPTCPSSRLCQPPALLLAASLRPTASGSVQQEIPPGAITFDDEGRAAVQLAAPVWVRGTVFGDGEAPIQAQVVVTRSALIVGLPNVEIQQSTDVRGRFEIAVARPQDLSTPYRLVVFPADSRYPPITRLILPAEDLDLALWVGATQTCARPGNCVTGTVRDSRVVQVTAVDPTSGARRSSVALTDDYGNFKLHLSPDVQWGDTLRIVAEHPGEGGTGTDGLHVMRDIRVSTAPVTLEMPSVLEMLLSLRVLSAAGKPAAGIRVDLVAKVEPAIAGGQEVSFSKSTFTDVSGVMTASLVASVYGRDVTYSVTALPHAGLHQGVTVRRVIVNAKAQPGDFLQPNLVLDERSVITGRLLDDSTGVSTAVANAAVSADPVVPVLGGGGEAGSALGALDVTAADGSFALYVDPGVYNIDFQPAMAAWARRSNVAVPKPIDGRGAILALDSVLLPRTLLDQLRVLDATGGPAAMVTVDLYVVETPPCQATVCPTTARLLNRAITDGSGRSQLFVPAP